MSKKILKYFLTVAMLTSIATFTFAEDAAPVYEVDNFPPQFDNPPEMGGGSFDAQANAQTNPQTNSQVSQANPNFNSDPNFSYAPPPSRPRSLTLEQRLSRAEQQIDNFQHNDSTSKLTTLQNEIQSLRGEVEQLTHQLQQLQSQQRTLYSDLEKRLNNQQTVKSESTDVLAKQMKPEVQAAKSSKKARSNMLTDDTITDDQPAASLESRNKSKSKLNSLPAANSTEDTAATTASVASNNDAQPNMAEEQQIYQTAYDLIKVKKYKEAITALQKMLKKYPTGQFAANAHYWLGELYNLLGNNNQAAVEFSNVVKNYPDSPKVSDAQLNLGVIYARQFKWSDAKIAFKKVITHYPGTVSSRLAAEQIKQMKAAGH